METNAAITDLKSLEAEIEQVRSRIRHKENKLNDLLEELPAQTVKKVVTTAASVFLANKVAFGISSVINKALKLLLNSAEKNKESNAKSDFFKTVGKLGFFSALKVAFNALLNKKPTEVI